MFCSAMTTVCEIALPLIVRQITDRAAHDIHDLTAELIIKIVGFYILLRIIDTAASYYTASGGHIMGARIETDMRNDLFSHLQDMSYSFYDDTKIGQLMSRITNDLFDITELAHHGPENVLMTVIKIVAGFIMFASMNIWLAIIVFSLMPLMMLLTSRSRRKMRAAFKQQRREIGEINARTEDSLLGIRVVKSFANEDIEREKFNEGSRRFFKSKKNGYRYMASFHCTVRLCDGLMYIAIVGVGAVFMMKGKTTVGDFSASLLMVSTLLAAIRTMVEFSEQFNRGMTGIERFTEIMDEVQRHKRQPGCKAHKRRQGRYRIQKRYIFIQGHGQKNSFRFLPAYSSGRECRPRRSVRRRQDYALQSYPPLLRCGFGQHTARRKRYPRHNFSFAALEYRHGSAGCLHVLRHGQGQHSLRMPGS